MRLWLPGSFCSYPSIVPGCPIACHLFLVPAWCCGRLIRLLRVSASSECSGMWMRLVVVCRWVCSGAMRLMSGFMYCMCVVFVLWCVTTVMSCPMIEPTLHPGWLWRVAALHRLGLLQLSGMVSGQSVLVATSLAVSVLLFAGFRVGVLSYDRFGFPTVTAVGLLTYYGNWLRLFSTLGTVGCYDRGS